MAEKFGVSPDSIPDYLALVGDSADGIPGVPRWGAKTAAQVLRRYGHIESIPDQPSEWGLNLRGINALAASLSEHRDEAMLYKDLTTLRLDVPISETLDQLEWHGVLRRDYLPLCKELGFSALSEVPHKWADE